MTDEQLDQAFPLVELPCPAHVLTCPLCGRKIHSPYPFFRCLHDPPPFRFCCEHCGRSLLLWHAYGPHAGPPSGQSPPIKPPRTP